MLAAQASPAAIELHDVHRTFGAVRAVDGIAYLAQAEVADATVLPNTLRARVRAVIAAVGLTAVVPVEPEVATGQSVVNPSFEDVDNPAAA